MVLHRDEVEADVVESGFSGGHGGSSFLMIPAAWMLFPVSFAATRASFGEVRPAGPAPREGCSVADPGVAEVRATGRGGWSADGSPGMRRSASVRIRS